MYNLDQPLSTSSFLKAPLTTSPGTRSKPFSKSTDAKYIFLFFAKYFPCNCRKIKLVFTVPLPGFKRNYVSSISTCRLINFPIIFSAVYRIRYVNFIPFPFLIIVVYTSAKFPFSLWITLTIIWFTRSVIMSTFSSCYLYYFLHCSWCFWSLIILDLTNGFSDSKVY